VRRGGEALEARCRELHSQISVLRKELAEEKFAIGIEVASFFGVV
jgi:hypothetical protein